MIPLSSEAVLWILIRSDRYHLADPIRIGIQDLQIRIRIHFSHM